MIDINAPEFSTRVFHDFDFELCKPALIDFYLMATKEFSFNLSVGLMHSGKSDRWTDQVVDGSYGNQNCYGSPGLETRALDLTSDKLLDPGIFSVWNSKFQELYPQAVEEFMRAAPGIVRPKIAMIPAGKCLPLHVDIANTRSFHLCIVTNPQTFFVVDGEFLRMHPGRWYILNTNVPHTVVNLGNTNIYHILAREPDTTASNMLDVGQLAELSQIEKIFRSIESNQDLQLQRSRVVDIIKYYINYCKRKDIDPLILKQHPLILDFAVNNQLL